MDSSTLNVLSITFKMRTITCNEWRVNFKEVKHWEHFRKILQVQVIFTNIVGSLLLELQDICRHCGLFSWIIFDNGIMERTVPTSREGIIISSSPLSLSLSFSLALNTDEANRPFYALHSSTIAAERINLPCPKTHYLT